MQSNHRYFRFPRCHEPDPPPSSGVPYQTPSVYWPGVLAWVFVIIPGLIGFVGYAVYLCRRFL